MTCIPTIKTPWDECCISYRIAGNYAANAITASDAEGRLPLPYGWRLKSAGEIGGAWIATFLCDFAPTVKDGEMVRQIVDGIGRLG